MDSLLYFSIQYITNAYLIVFNLTQPGLAHTIYHYATDVFQEFMYFKSLAYFICRIKRLENL
jgi:hypothetical protein